MVPFWGKQLFIRVALFVALSTALLVVVWTISQGSGQASHEPAQARIAPHTGDAEGTGGQTTRAGPPTTPSSPTEKKQATPPTAVSPEKPTKPEPRGKELRGAVRAIDPEKRTVTLRVGEKREAAYRLAPDARITNGTSDMPLGNVQRGARVRALLGDEDMIVELRVDRKRPDD